jgi:hypothetical protein
MLPLPPVSDCISVLPAHTHPYPDHIDLLRFQGTCGPNRQDSCLLPPTWNLSLSQLPGAVWQEGCLLPTQAVDFVILSLTVTLQHKDQVLAWESHPCSTAGRT